MDKECELLSDGETVDMFESSYLLEFNEAKASLLLRRGKKYFNISIRNIILGLLHSVLISTSATFFILSFTTHHKEYCSCSNLHPSLLGHEWDTNTFAERFDGSLKAPSIYKGPPSEAVDEAWEKITPLHLIRITESEFENINASIYAAEISDEEGGRIAIFEAFHMIHCLKSLWQNTYPDYYSEKYAHNQEHQEEWHEHMDHCTDMIRQQLMCAADTSLITYNWLKNHYYPHPNFNVEHQCRDYDRLLQVAAERKIDRVLLRPEGKTVVEFEQAPFDPEADS